MKKTLLLVSCVGLMSMILASCHTAGKKTSSTSDEPISRDSSGNIDFKDVTIDFWNPITGADSTNMSALVNMFNEEYDGRIKVLESPTAETEYYEMLPIQIQQNQGPDVALVHSYKIPNYALTGGVLRPIQPIMETAGVDIKREDYITDVYDAMSYEGTLYGIPLDIHTTGIYYNKTMMKQLNITSVPTNRAELIAAAKKCQNSTIDGTWGLPMATEWPSEWSLTSAFYQNGGTEVLDDDKPGFNNDIGKKSVEMISNLVHVEKISPTNVAVDADLMMFKQGKALFHINGDWMLNGIVEAAEAKNFEFGVIPMSKMFTDDPNGANANDIAARSHCFILPQGNKRAIRQQAAMVFIKYVTEHAYEWAKCGHIPASNLARETEEYKALPYQPQFGDISHFRVNQPNPYWQEAFKPYFLSVTNAMKSANCNISQELKNQYDEGVQHVAIFKDSIGI